jgi:hypothetical protein
MQLQRQTANQGRESPAENSFCGRLSRIVTKLFGKVIKAEEHSLSPFSFLDKSMDELVNSMEMTLNETRIEGPGYHEGREMVDLLLSTMVKFRGVAAVMASVKRNSGSLVLTVLARFPEDSLPENSCNPSLVASSYQPVVLPSAPYKDVAELVSAIGSAPEGRERTSALDALRQYRDLHGNHDLNKHLENVSEKFRAYIWEQLLNTSEVLGRDQTSQNDHDIPMSARIRNLRSRLRASDVPIDFENTSAKEIDESPSIATVPSRIPTPSKLPNPGAGALSTSTTILSLRERLAMAQAKRPERTDPAKANIGVVQPQVITSQAQALRARLQAVKNQSTSYHKPGSSTTCSSPSSKKSVPKLEVKLEL